MWKTPSTTIRISLPKCIGGALMGRSRLSVFCFVGSVIGTILGDGLARISKAQTQPLLASYSAPSLTARLQTTVVDWDALAVRQIPQGLSRPVFDNPASGLDKIEVHITTLDPGMTLHGPHRHAWEEMCLVREGEVQVSINGQKHRAVPGSLAFFSSGDGHSIANDSDKPATYVVMNICAPLARTLPQAPTAEIAAGGKLKSGVFDCNSVPKTSTATGSCAIVFDSPTLTFTRLRSQITTVDPGQSTGEETLESENA